MNYEFVRIIMHRYKKDTRPKMKITDRKKNIRRTAIIVAVVLSAIPLLILVNFLWMLGEIKFNQIKWQNQGFSEYQITTKLDSFSEISGTYILDVKNNKVIQVTVIKANWPDSSHPPQDYDGLIIDGLFQKANSCISHYLSYWCSIQFDSQYGYPTKIHINCDNADMCFADISVEDIKLSSK